MTTTDINTQIKTIVKLFTPEGERKFPAYNLNILKSYFRTNQIKYEITPPAKPEEKECHIYFWDENNYGMGIKILVNTDMLNFDEYNERMET